MTLKVHFDGRVFVPDDPVNLPTGAQYEITLTRSPGQAPVTSPPTPSPTKTLLGELAKIAYEFPDDPNAPTDGAAQHDHYLYGVPKRP